MSKDKLTLSDLAVMVAESAEVSHKAAEDFLKALFQTVEESLLAKDNVKIRQLGNFKVSYNSPRKSVDVNTGEEITIEGYNKVVFTPETTLKDLVNEPFAHLTPIPLDIQENIQEVVEAPVKKETMDPLRTLGEQASEIKSILNEMGALKSKPEPVSADPVVDPLAVESPEAEQKETVILTDAQEKETVILTDEQSETIESAEPFAAQVLAEMPEEVEPVQSAAIQEQVTEVPAASEVSTGTPHPPIVGTGKRSASASRVLAGLSTVILILVMLYGLFNWEGIRSFIEPGTKVSVTVPAPAVQPVISDSVSLQETADSLSADSLAVENGTEIQKDIFAQPRNYTELLTTVQMSAGNRLTLLALKYYGAKEFWVYIFEANMEQIKNPNEVKEGMTVRIPRLNESLIDLKNPKTLEYALSLKTKYTK